MLHVRSPFEGHEVGDAITDPEMIEAIMADHRAAFVVRVADTGAEPAPHPES